MKKSFKNFMLLTIATSLIGLGLVNIACAIFGEANVFIFCFLIVLICGLILPIIQMRDKDRAKRGV